ncbi:MAG: hypothetical protein KAV18_01195, partial [Candidatus Omnitrophica bacterium]|nr:hypothetical protein [Candidatus Omnitrophota bacterium]
MNLNKNLNRFLPKPIVRDIAGRIAGALFFSFFIYKECLYLQNSYKTMAWLDKLTWFLITTNYSLYVLAFLIRHKPKAAASRLLEFLIPAVVCIQPFLIHLALIISETPRVFPILTKFESQLDRYLWIRGIFEMRYQLCPLVSQWLIIIGAAIFVTGAFFL